MATELRACPLFDYDYFLRTWNEFFSLCSNKNSTVQNIFDGWSALLYVYTKTETDKDLTVPILAAQENMIRRLPYFELQALNEWMGRNKREVDRHDNCSTTTGYGGSDEP